MALMYAIQNLTSMEAGFDFHVGLHGIVLKANQCHLFTPAAISAFPSVQTGNLTWKENSN